MTRVALDCDVLVIGAGPAGAAAAQLLASWGWTVTLSHRAGSPQHALAESLPASTRKILAQLGQLERVERADCYPNHGNVAHWAGVRRATMSDDSGFHVARASFDDVLRDGARASGARVLNATIKRVDEHDDHVRAVSVSADGAQTTLRAHYVLDCSGRAGVVARRGLRRADAGVNTLAIVAEWEFPRWPADERTRTTVESYRDGWAWSVPLSPTRRQCTVMIDRPRGRPEPLSDVYARELAKARALAGRVADAEQVSVQWTCDASTYDSTSAADGRALLVGDAASFIDPLSSAGVKKALVSAWRAAVVVNTCLARSSMTAAALDLHAQRERQIYADYAGRSRAFFAEAEAAYDTPFWSTRRASCDAASTPADEDDLGDDALSRDAGVRTAFEHLRGASTLRLRPADALRFEPLPAIEGREVVMRDAIVVPGRKAPLQFAAGVDLAALARLARDGRDVSALIAAYHARIGAVPVGGLLTGLSLLVARNALVAEDSPS